MHALLKQWTSEKRERDGVKGQIFFYFWPLDAPAMCSIYIISYQHISFPLFVTMTPMLV